MKHTSHFILLSLMLMSMPVRAQGSLETHDIADPALIGLGLAVWGTGELLKEDMAPESCRWCARNDLDESVRNAIRWDSHNDWAATGSDVLLGTLVLSSGALAQYWSEEQEDGLAGGIMVVESIAVSSILNQIVKFSVGRERPYVRTLDDPASVSRDRNLSFYSGHTSTAFAAAVAGAWAYELEGGPHPKIVWASLLGLASMVGYLRMAADKHYFTDVLTGALMGSAVAWAVVTLHKTDDSSTSFKSAPYAMIMPSKMVLVGFTIVF